MADEAVKFKIYRIAFKSVPGWGRIYEVYDDGDKVAPGVYLYQVIADTDDGEKIEGGSVVVAY